MLAKGYLVISTERQTYLSLYFTFDREFPTCNRTLRMLSSISDAVSPTGSLVHLKAVLYVSAAFY